MFLFLEMKLVPDMSPPNLKFNISFAEITYGIDFVIALTISDIILETSTVKYIYIRSSTSNHLDLDP